MEELRITVPFDGFRIPDRCPICEGKIKVMWEFNKYFCTWCGFECRWEIWCKPKDRFDRPSQRDGGVMIFVREQFPLGFPIFHSTSKQRQGVYPS